MTQGGTVATYNYIWNGEKLVSQSDGTDTFYFFYNDSEYAPDGFVLNGTDTYLYTKNLQGDIIGIADENGNIVTTYTYDAWGKVLSTTGTGSSTIGKGNPFRYRGYYYDTETELYYLQSRYYNPEWGRFLNADMYVDTAYYSFGSNMFAYCENNPVNYLDYYGRFKGKDHYNITNKIALEFVSKKNAKLIAEYAKKVDDIYSPLNYYSPYCQSFHFNINIGTRADDSRFIRSAEFFQKAIDYIIEAAAFYKKGNIKKYNSLLESALKNLGISIHPLQDYYAHSGSDGHKTGYIYYNIYTGKQFISLSKMTVGKDIVQTGVFYHHLFNKDVDDIKGKYLNTGKTKEFYALRITYLQMAVFMCFVETYLGGKI